MRRALAAFVLGMMCLGAPLAGHAQTRLPPDGFADLSERLMPAVVNIATTQRIQGMSQGPEGGRFGQLFGPDAGEVNSLGSGFIISADGVIVTNNHVIEAADEIEVIMQDGERLEATLLGRDPATDIAVLKVNAGRALPAVKFAAGRGVRVGELVLAIGNPFGLGGSVSAGIVSARNRDISAGRYDDFIQTDAAINRGNSGGPLFNMAGDVIGVNTAIVSPSGGSVGVGFAAPADLVRPVIEQIVQFGETRRGWLGVRLGQVTPEIAQRVGMARPRGALITAVTPNSPAARAGLQVGDVVISFGGKEIIESRNLTRYVAEAEIEGTTALEYLRGMRRLSANVKVERLDEGRPRTLLAGEKGGRALAAPGPNAPEGRALGITLAQQTPAMRQRFNLTSSTKGLVVTAVDPSSDAAGKIQPGDMIVEMQFENVQTVSQAQRVAERFGQNNRPVLIYLERAGDKTFRSVRARRR
jgi:serine protease Do